MATVPRYQQTVSPQNLPSVRVQQQDFGQAELTRGVQAAAQAGVGIAQQIAEEERRRAEATQMLEADRLLGELEMRLFHDPETGAYARRGREAIGLPEQVWPEWDKEAGRVIDGLPAQIRPRVQGLAQNRRQSLEQTLSRHIMAQSEQYQAQEAAAYIETSTRSAVANRTDPGRVDDEIARAMVAAEATGRFRGMTPEARVQAQFEIESRIRGEVLSHMIEDDPFAAQTYVSRYSDRLAPRAILDAERKLQPILLAEEARATADVIMGGGQAGTTFDEIVAHTMRLEGGYTVDTGGPTNFGISSRANPDIDVDSLTPGRAREIYRERYWQAINADSLPANVRDVAFDAAVNHGIGRARRMIAEAGGDRDAFLAIREAEYRRLAEADPGKYGQYLNGWLNRVESFRGMAPGENGVPRETAQDEPTLPQALRAAGQIRDPRLRRAAEQEISSRYALREAEKREHDQAMIESIMAAVENADPLSRPSDFLTSSQLAWASEQGRMGAIESRMSQRLTGLDARTNPVVLAEWQAVFTRAENGDQAALEQVRDLDPTTLYDSLGRQERDYVQARRGAIMKAAQGDTAAASKAADFATEDRILQTYAYGPLGFLGMKPADKAEAQAQFMRSFLDEKARRQQAKGEPLTDAETRDVVQGLVLEVARQRPRFGIGGVFGQSTDRRRVFEVIQDITAADLQAAEEVYRRRYGTEPDYDEILQTFLRGTGYVPQTEN